MADRTFLTSLAASIQRLPQGLKPLRFGRKQLWLAGKILAGLALSGVLGVIGLWFLVRAGAWGDLPDEAALSSIQHYTASEVYTADSVLMGTYYLENRTNVTYEGIAPCVIQALVATEDARFYLHSGVDTRSLVRVGVKSLLLQDRSSGGGSTLSQQLAKNLFPRQRYGLLSMPINKFREMMIAQRLEKVYSKEDILTLYLNTVPFGEKVYGIAVASRRFFNTSPDRLKPEQAAVLVGMLKATTAYNPRLNPERSLQRRNVVLQQMLKADHLTPEEADSLTQLPLGLEYRYITHNTGLAPYFREHLRLELEHVLEGTPFNIYKDGLKIYTTIDSRLQTFAEQSVATEMKRLQALFDEHWKDRAPWGASEDVIQRAMQRSDRYEQLKRQGMDDARIQQAFEQEIPMQVFSWAGEEARDMSPMDSLRYYNRLLHAGFLALEPGSGYIKAWVGGINHKYFQYDHVTSHRQVGSTFKPIVYATALELGKDPCDYISNEKVVYETHDNWAPGNADGHYEGAYSMEGGLSKSVNTITVKLMMDAGVERVSRLAHRMGIRSDLPPDPSMALGTADLSLYEMLTVYATLVNRGKRVLPVYITSITDRNGQVIKAPKAPKARPALRSETADMMIQMMQSVVDSGTAASLRYHYGLDGDLIGKTGTTQSHADGWFIGATPSLVAGAWVGAEDRRVRFRSLRLGQGAKTALPIWGTFMKQVYQQPDLRRQYRGRFPEPSPQVLRRLDCPHYRAKDPNRNFWDFLDFTNRRKRDVQEREDESRTFGPSSKREGEGVFERFLRKKREKERQRREQERRP